MKPYWAKSRTSISSGVQSGERVENNCLSARTGRRVGNDDAKRWSNFRPPATLCTELLALHCRGMRVSDPLLRFFEWRSRAHISIPKEGVRESGVPPLTRLEDIRFARMLLINSVRLAVVAVVLGRSIVFAPFLSMCGSGVLMISCSNFARPYGGFEGGFRVI